MRSYARPDFQCIVLMTSPTFIMAPFTQRDWRDRLEQRSPAPNERLPLKGSSPTSGNAPPCDPFHGAAFAPSSTDASDKPPRQAFLDLGRRHGLGASAKKREQQQVPVRKARRAHLVHGKQQILSGLASRIRPAAGRPA